MILINKPHSVIHVLLVCFKQDEVKESQAELARHKEMLKERSKEISGLSDKVHELQKESASIDLEMREVDHKIIKATKDSKDAAKLVLMNMLCSN